MAPTGGHLLTWILFSVNLMCINGWDTDDFELFDVVEDVNMNFYDLLGIEQSASSQEIRKAYRKLSLQYHPDKNKEEDAETKFRQLVAVYEILKDENKRKKYHEVLQNGLPDWRQPVFYYRRVRKMGILEFLAFMVSILTVGQYIVMWSIFAEKKFTLTENFEAVRKRKEKKLRKTKSAAAAEDEIEEELQEELEAIPRPSWKKLWPIQLVKYLVLSIYNSPTTIREGLRSVQDWQEQRRLAKLVVIEDEEEEEEEVVKKPKKKKTDILESAAVVCSDGAPVVYAASAGSSEMEMKQQVIKDGEWTDDELALLAKAASKYPGGSLNRWEKIADMVGRSVTEVTAKCKTMKGTYTMNIDVSLQSGGLKQAKRSQNITEDMITQKDDLLEKNEENDNKETTTVRRRHKPAKTAERTLMIPNSVPKTDSHGNSLSNIPKETQEESCAKKLEDSENSLSWNKNQQMILEWALRQYPKGTDQRWDKIAEHIPGKSKEDCIARFKHLADLVKRKKEQTLKTDSETTNS